MCGNLVCIAAVLLGIDAGWKPLPEGGGMEYHIQIEPELLETLKSGQPIQSDIPPYVRNVRAYKITVGTEELTRELPTPDSAETTSAKPAIDLVLPPPAIPAMRPDISAAATLPDSPSTEPPSPAPLDSVEKSEASDIVLPDVPAQLDPDPAGKPLDVRQAAHVAPIGPAPSPKAESPVDEKSSREEPSKPWLPLTATLLGLFASFGGNLFLGWVTWGTRRRYRLLVEETRGVAA